MPLTLRPSPLDQSEPGGPPRIAGTRTASQPGSPTSTAEEGAKGQREARPGDRRGALPKSPCHPPLQNAAGRTRTARTPSAAVSGGVGGSSGPAEHRSAGLGIIPFHRRRARGRVVGAPWSLQRASSLQPPRRRSEFAAVCGAGAGPEGRRLLGRRRNDKEGFCRFNQVGGSLARCPEAQTKRDRSALAAAIDIRTRRTIAAAPAAVWSSAAQRPALRRDGVQPCYTESAARHDTAHAQRWRQRQRTPVFSAVCRGEPVRNQAEPPRADQSQAGLFAVGSFDTSAGHGSSDTVSAVADPADQLAPAAGVQAQRGGRQVR